LTTKMWLWRATRRVSFFMLLSGAYLVFSLSISSSHVRALMFVVGILLYEALSHKAFRGALAKRGEVIAILLFLASIGVSYLMGARNDLFSFLPGWWAGQDSAGGVVAYQGPYKAIVLGIGLFWCTAYCLAFDGALERCFSWRPLRCLGNMSYSYYLIHGVTLQGVALLWTLLSPRGNPSIASFLIALVVGFTATWVVSTLLFVFIERPLSLERKRIRPLVTVAEKRTAVWDS